MKQKVLLVLASAVFMTALCAGGNAFAQDKDFLITVPLEMHKLSPEVDKVRALVQATRGPRARTMFGEDDVAPNRGTAIRFAPDVYIGGGNYIDITPDNGEITRRTLRFEFDAYEGKDPATADGFAVKIALHNKNTGNWLRPFTDENPPDDKKWRAVKPGSNFKEYITGDLQQN